MAARWTARIALALFVAGESLLLASRGSFTHGAKAGSVHWPKRLLLGAVVAYLLHAAVALLWVHGGSHAAAWEHTAAQTEKWIGWRTGSGLYVNYAFTLLVCLAVAIDSRWLRSVARAAAWFMGLQGGVVFAPSPFRWASLSLMIVGPLLGLSWRAWRANQDQRLCN